MLGGDFFLGGDDIDVPSLTPASDWDLKESLAFTRQAGEAFVDFPWRTLNITSYTDSKKDWTALRYKYALRLARWNFARCHIRLSATKLHILSSYTLSQKNGLVISKIPLKLSRTTDRYETFLLLTKQVRYHFGVGRGSSKKRKATKLLGLSSLVYSKNSGGKWQSHYAVWVRWSPILTTLTHELGYRLGLRHTKRAYDLMLTGSIVRSSGALLWTSMKGFFDTKLFHFDARQCAIMHRVLRKEQRILRLPKAKKVTPFFTKSPKNSKVKNSF